MLTFRIVYTVPLSGIRSQGYFLAPDELCPRPDLSLDHHMLHRISSYFQDSLSETDR